MDEETFHSLARSIDVGRYDLLRSAIKEHGLAYLVYNDTRTYGLVFVAAQTASSTEGIKVFLEAGLDLSYRNNRGCSLLCLAAYSYRAENIRVLLEAGMSPNIQCNHCKHRDHLINSLEREITSRSRRNVKTAVRLLIEYGLEHNPVYHKDVLETIHARNNVRRICILTASLHRHKRPGVTKGIDRNVVAMICKQMWSCRFNKN